MMVLLFCNHRINSVLRTHKPPQHFLKLFIGYTSYQVWYSWINDAFDSDFLNRRSSHYTIGQPTISQKNVGPHTSFALHINISRSDRTVSNWYSIIDFTHILYPIWIRHQNWYTLILNKILQLSFMFLITNLLNKEGFELCCQTVITYYQRRRTWYHNVQRNQCMP